MTATQIDNCLDPIEEADIAQDLAEELSELLTKSGAPAAGCIDTVIVTRQKDIELYTFKLTAQEMVDICRVERFGVHETGVQRRFKQRRAWRMAEIMLTGEDVTFSEAPRGSLEKGWTFRDGKLYFDAGAFITLDDGQHRCGAMHLHKVFTTVSKFNWTADKAKGESEAQLRDRLDAAIGNALAREADAGEIKA